jgi:hypothetical protein
MAAARGNMKQQAKRAIEGKKPHHVCGQRTGRSSCCPLVIASAQNIQ